MSDTTRLGVSITATDVASASIKAVNAEIKALQKSTEELGKMAAQASAISAASIQKEIGVNQARIASLREAAAAQGTVAAATRATTAATNEAAAASSILSREMRHVVGLFDSIARGQRGQAMSSIGAGMRDAGLGVAALSTSVIGLVALMGGAAILRGAEAMGKWATETRAAASAVGMSLQDYSALQGALTLTGLKSTEADSALRRLAVNLATALADPTSKVAEAFHALGISQEDLIKTGGNVDSALKLLADAFVRTADGANKSAALSAVAGRSYGSLIPLLQGGVNGLDALKEKAKELGLILTDTTAKSLEDTGKSVEEVGKKIRGDAIQAFEAWGPAISLVVDLLGDLLTVIGKVVSAPILAFSAAKNAVTSANEQLAQQGLIYDPNTGMLLRGPTQGAAPGSGMLGSEMAGVGPKAAVPPMTKGGAGTSSEAQRNLQMATAEAAASKGGSRTAELQAGIKVLQEWIAKDKEGSKEMIADRTALAEKQKELNNEMASGGAKAAKQSYSDFASAESLKIASAEGSSAKIKAIYDEWISAAIGKYHQLMSVVDQLRAKELEAVNAAKRGEIMQRGKTDEQAATLKDLNDRLAAFQSGTAPVRGQKLGPTGDIEQAQQYIAQAQQVDAQYKEQTASLKQYGATAEQVVALETQAKSKEVALYEKAAEASQKAVEKVMEPWTKLFDNIGSEFEGLTSSILSAVISPQITLLKEGLTTKRVSESGNQIGAAFRKMLLDGISSAANSVQTALGHMLANALSGGQANTLGELLSQKLTQGLTAIFPSLAGSLGGAAGAAGTAGATTAATTALGAFTTALGGATAALTGHTGVTVTNAGATVANTGATATDTIATVTSSGATAVNTVGTTVNTASTAVNTTGIFAHTGAILLSTVSFVGNTIATVANTIATIINSIASNPIGALAMVGGVAFGMSKMERGGIVPSAAGGMMVGGTGASLAILHAREMVLPAPISMGLQAMIHKNTGGGGPTNTASLNYAPTINTGSRSRGGTGMSRSEFSQLLALHSGAMLGEARNMMRNGWRP